MIRTPIVLRPWARIPTSAVLISLVLGVVLLLGADEAKKDQEKIQGTWVYVSAMQGTGRLTVRTGLDEGFVLVEIGDTGPGVPPAIRERIFEPFFTTKSVGDGTGLGLSMVHGIVTRHGGRVTIRSSNAPFR